MSRGVQLEWPGVPSAPIQTPSRVLWEEEAEADTQTTQMQSGKAEGQSRGRPGVKHKVAEWGKLKINPKDFCRETPSKQGQARGKSNRKQPPHSLNL